MGMKPRMTWVKIPPEHHPIFEAALPDDSRSTTIKMFGGVGAMVNGNMYAGLFARSAMVRLGDADREKALALKGAGVAPMSGMAMLPESVLHDGRALRNWLAKGLKHTAMLPPKKKKK